MNGILNKLLLLYKKDYKFGKIYGMCVYKWDFHWIYNMKM